MRETIAKLGRLKLAENREKKSAWACPRRNRCPHPFGIDFA